MTDGIKKSAYKRHVALLLFCAVAVAASFAWQGRAGINLGDEGYLWYGVQRVMRGEVPIRDFLSYDPGRYYFSAALMSAWGDDGLVSLRVAVAIFQAAGLFAALWTLARARADVGLPLLALAALTLLAWMYPRHKLFDITVSIALVAALAWLLERPSRRNHFLAGIAVGVAATFGRNHGVYGAAAGVLALAWMAIGTAPSTWLRNGVAWSAGVAAGFSPILAMAAFVPGFADAFLQAIGFHLESGSTNLPLAVPWPWRVPVGRLGALDTLAQVLVGVLFIAVAAFGVLGAAWAFARRFRKLDVPPLIAACAFLSLPYAHFAYSRADVGHLAQGIFPLLIGAFALLVPCTAPVRWAGTAAMCAASLLIMLPLHPGWRCAAPGACMAADVGSDRLTIESDAAANLAMLRELSARYAPGKTPFYVAPFWPGAYAALDRPSPVWEIYPLFPRSDSLQQAEIARLRAASPGFAVVFDHPLDGREELRFRNTHPLIQRYLDTELEPVTGHPWNPSYRIYRARSRP
jgi:hypothetical protein